MKLNKIIVLSLVTGLCAETNLIAFGGMRKPVKPRQGTTEETRGGLDLGAAAGGGAATTPAASGAGRGGAAAAPAVDPRQALVDRIFTHVENAERLDPAIHDMVEARIAAATGAGAQSAVLGHLGDNKAYSECCDKCAKKHKAKKAAPKKATKAKKSNKKNQHGHDEKK